MKVNIQNQRSLTEGFIPENPEPLQSPQMINNYSLEEIIAGSDIAIWAFDVKTMRVNICATFKRMLTLPEKNDYPFVELFRQVDSSNRNSVLKDIRAACDSPNTFSIEFMVKERSGINCRWFKLTGKAYGQRGEWREAFMGTLTDITEAKIKEIWNNDRLALLSHELKGPLSVIRLYLQRAGKITADQKVEDAALFLSRADDQVSAMTLLMDDFLSFSTIGNAKMKLFYECFDVATIVDDIIIQMQLKHPGYQFVIKVPSSINIRADKRKITQVILNYLSNAVKYSSENSRIEIKCRKKNRDMIMSVTDHGIGIDPEFHQKVFERYYRTPGTRADGFGLGLYLVKEIVKGHGGNVWVDSEVNKGSTFCFSLPQSVNTYNHKLVN
jgi:nitrogen fixation/metabolism regulation signal transduction histidine kinase